MTRFLSRSSGFTLVELAMVLFIVSLLIGGLLMPLSAQNEVRGRQETDRALANIREALIGFAAINGRLPCPADRTIASGVANAG
jgi:prepilin-type N-terminal cleavage/methylation domain-containing protein